jgi:hypothetical protein
MTELGIHNFSLSRFKVFRDDLTWIGGHPSIFQTHVLPPSPSLKVKGAFFSKYQYLPPKLQGMTYHKIWDTQILAARLPKFNILMPKICGSSVWRLLHVTLLRPRILGWLLDFWKICEPLHKTVILIVTAHETSQVQFSFYILHS